MLATLGRHARAEAPASVDASTGKPGLELLTIFLRHDETKTIDQINHHLKETGWFKDSRRLEPRSCLGTS